MRIVISFLVFVVSLTSFAQNVTVTDSLYSYGEYSKAIEAYKPYENKSDVAQKIAKAYIAIGNYDKALAYYEKAILADTKNQLYKYEYAKLLLRVKQLDNAYLVFEELAKINSTNPNYQYELGNVKRVLGDSTYIKNYEETYRLDSNHLKAINKIGRFALTKRDYEKALKMADIGLSIYNKSKELTSLKAQTYYWQEDYFHAKDWFLKRLTLGEPTQFIYEKLSYCYERNYEHKGAIEYLEKALKFDPKNGTNLYLIGRQYSLMDDFVNAEKYFKRAVEILDQPLDREYSNLASALNRQEKYKEAIKAYSRGLQQNPNSKYIPFFITHTKAQMYKDIDAKIKVYEDYIKNYPKSSMKQMAEFTVEKLKKEKFMKGDETKD